MCEYLSENDYKEAAINYFGNKNVKVLSHQLKPISELRKGFSGEHYKIEFTCEVDGTKKEAILFLKAKLNKNSSQLEIIEELGIYEREIFFYDVLKRAFDKLGCDTSFAPKCYHCVPGSCLILENITLSGFELSPFFTFYNLEQCHTGIRSLAYFHASGYVFEETKSKELGKKYRLVTAYPELFAKEMFYDMNAEDNLGMEWIKASRTAYIGLIDVMPESEEYKEEFKKKLEVVQIGLPFAKDYPNIRKTVGHGDLWSNNMMFKLENGVEKQCCLLDFQLVRYYFPVFDILLFLYTNTSKQFRQNHMKDLLDFYYKVLSDEVKRRGFNLDDIHPRRDFEETLNIVPFEAMLHGFACQSFWIYTEEDMSEVLGKGKDDMLELWHGNRVQLLIEQMNRVQSFKKMMLDNLYDFHYLLFKN